MLQRFQGPRVTGKQLEAVETELKCRLAIEKIIFIVNKRTVENVQKIFA